MTGDKLSAYGRALRIRRRIFLWIAALGLLGLVVSITLLPSSGLPPIARAFYRGGSFGVLVSSLVWLARTQFLLRRPERWKENRVRETDERIRHINWEAAQFAGTALVFLLTAAAFLLVAVDWRLGVLLSGLILAYFALFLLARWRLSKKV